MPYTHCVIALSFVKRLFLLYLIFFFVFRATYFISSPNVIRVGVDETIVINLFGRVNTGNAGVPVTVEIQNYPARTTTYCTTTVNVKKSKNNTRKPRINPNTPPHKN